MVVSERDSHGWCSWCLPIQSQWLLWTENIKNKLLLISCVLLFQHFRDQSDLWPVCGPVRWWLGETNELVTSRLQQLLTMLTLLTIHLPIHSSQTFIVSLRKAILEDISIDQILKLAIQKLSKIVRRCQKLSKVIKSCQKLSKVVKSCQKSIA